MTNITQKLPGLFHIKTAQIKGLDELYVALLGQVVE